MEVNIKVYCVEVRHWHTYLGSVAEDLRYPCGIEHEKTQIKHSVKVIHNHEARENHSICPRRPPSILLSLEKDRTGGSNVQKRM